MFIKQLLAEALANAWTLDAVALSQGPGSYTGLVPALQKVYVME